MSWQVNGVVYHDYQGYRAALARREAQQSQRVAAEAARNVQRLQARIAERERELARTRQDLQKQAELSAALRNDVSAMQRAQGELARHQQEAEANLNRQLDEARRDQARTVEALAAVEREHAVQAAATRQAFADVDRQLQQGLAQAAQQLNETEARLKKDVAAVERKLEQDRAERLGRERDDMARAAERVRMAEDELSPLLERLEPLDLGENHAAIASRLMQARALHQHGDASAALAAAYLAHADARVLRQTAIDRQAKLLAAREAVLAEIAYLREMMQDKQAKRFFKQEIAETARLLDAVERRASAGYGRYAWLVTEQNKDEDLLTGERAKLSAMISRAPVLRDLAADRNTRLEEILKRLTDVKGKATNLEVRLADPEDLKSDQVVTLQFGRSKMQMHMSLDGEIKLDSYGHDSNRDCSRDATAALQALAPMAQFGQPQVESGNRDQPMPSAARGQTQRAGSQDTLGMRRTGQ